MRVTQMEEVGKGRYKVFLEGEPAFVLYKKEADRYGLRPGEELKEESYREILQEVLGKRSKRYCMNLLKTMDRTEGQLRQKLRQSGYPEEVIGQAIDYVKGWGYVDDGAYARRYVESQREKKSLMQMRQELLQKGVDREEIARAMEEADVADETIAIEKWIAKKRMDLNKAEPLERQKLYMFLLRKGFSPSNVSKVFKRTGEFHETDTFT